MTRRKKTFFSIICKIFILFSVCSLVCSTFKFHWVSLSPKLSFISSNRVYLTERDPDCVHFSFLCHSRKMKIAPNGSQSVQSLAFLRLFLFFFLTELAYLLWLIEFDYFQEPSVPGFIVINISVGSLQRLG